MAKTANNKQKWVMLTAATLLLTLNFWAWSLLAPLAPVYASKLQLSPIELSMLLAVPVIIGSLARIPLGAMTDKYGGRWMFALITALASLPVIGLAFASGYNELLIAALCLGTGGAAFAVGVPFVSAWFAPSQRGLALGLYAIGDAGTAVAALATPELARYFSQSVVFFIIAAVLLVASVAMALWGKNAPTWKPVKSSVWRQLQAAAKWPHTWSLSLVYALTFGAFVALGMYLPTLLMSAHKLELVDAAAKAAGFVLVATAARPIGGWLSDRVGGVGILRIVFALLTILAGLVALDPTLFPLGTIIYLSFATVLGIGSGAVFGLLSRRCDKQLIGAVTGIVGTAGGLGGFFPPLVMGVSYQVFDSYSAALYLLAAVCLVTFLSMGRLFPPVAKQAHKK